jgi:hypothetical protein
VARRRWPPAATALDALIEEAIVDAYGDDEQRVGFLTMLEERLDMPSKVLKQNFVASHSPHRLIAQGSANRCR